MARDEFEDAVRDALDEIPAELARVMDNVVVLVEDHAPPDEPDLLGLYEGTPLTERTSFWAAGSLPDRIFVYRLPTLAICDTPRRRGRGGGDHGGARDRAPLRHRRRQAARAGLGLMGHDHSHGHATAAHAHRGRLAAVLALTLTVMVVEVIGGIVSGSFALVADAGHMLTDAAGVALALGATALAARPATAERTFGWQRAEMLAALVNGLLIARRRRAGARGRRAPHRRPAGGRGRPHARGRVRRAWWRTGSGCVLLVPGQRDSLNVRGAYLEVLGDLLGSAAVIVAALVVLATGLRAGRRRSRPCSSA